MNRSLLLAPLVAACCLALQGCTVIYGAAPNPRGSGTLVLAGRAPFIMGHVSLCENGGCERVLTYEDVDGLKIQSISSSPNGKELWVVAGSPLLYQGRVYSCVWGRGCNFVANWADLDRTVDVVAYDPDEGGQSDQELQTERALKRAIRVEEEEFEEDLRVDKEELEEDVTSQPSKVNCGELAALLWVQLDKAGIDEVTAANMLKKALENEGCQE